MTTLKACLVSRGAKLISRPLITRNDVSYTRWSRPASRRRVASEFHVAKKSSPVKHADRMSSFGLFLVAAFSLELEYFLFLSFTYSFSLSLSLYFYLSFLSPVYPCSNSARILLGRVSLAAVRCFLPPLGLLPSQNVKRHAKIDLQEDCVLKNFVMQDSQNIRKRNCKKNINSDVKRKCFKNLNNVIIITCSKK